MTRSTLGAVGWVLLTVAAAGLGGFASARAGAFYAELRKPGWAPPGWLFGPAWSVLYTAMATAAVLVWRSRDGATPGGAGPDEGADGGHGAVRVLALQLFAAQLALNALWPWIFFRWRLGGWAMVEVVLLWTAVLATLLVFWQVRWAAGALLVPYLAWVTYASALTWAVWRMNPERL